MKVKLLGKTSKELIDKQIQICATAGKLSRMPGTVFDAYESMEDPEKALKFINRVISMGHTSTIDHDYLVFALSEVSPIVEQTIIEERFSSFTIKSRREVNFANVGYYTPEFNDKNLTKKYQKHMEYLFSNYQNLIDLNIPKEDARFILPYSYHSEIIMGLDGTSLTRMINNLTKTKLSNIPELKELGLKLYEITKKRAPYIETLVEKVPIHNYSDTENILNSLGIKKQYSLLENPVLLNYTNNIDETIFINAISRIYSKTIEDASVIYNTKIKDDDKLKEKLMKSLFNETNCEDLRQINFRFQLSIPFAILTHYTRHRRISLSIPDFVPNVDLEKYITPPTIKNNKEARDIYKRIYIENNKIYNEFKSANISEESLAYFTLSGNAVNVIINFDGEAFRWICRLRECNKAQWFIRDSFSKMHKSIAKICTYYAKNVGPDCETKHICGEEKESCGKINIILKNLK